MTDGQPARMRPVDREEGLRLLSTTRFGRIVFTVRGLLEVRPVDHLVDGGDVIMRTHTGAAVLRAVGQVVAYQADHVTAGPLLEWNVVVIGVAEVETDSEAIARYERTLLPTVDLPMDHVLRIQPELVSGDVLDKAGDLPATG
jgi:hypothetical protein